jgi:CBS domain-containing protein
MSTARDIMSGDAECVGANDTLRDAAKRMQDLDVGSLPICGDDDRLQGMITDRDIALAVADGKDPQSTTVIDLGAHEVVTVGADDSLDVVLDTMAQHQVRRLPVIDGHNLVGVVSQADVAKNCPEERVGDLVEAISRG